MTRPCGSAARVELPVYERLGDTLSAAITWGQIADIAYKRGDYDEALRIRREVQLPVYERLGDTRSAAINLGQRSPTSPISSAATMTKPSASTARSSLPAFERLGDTRSAAITWGQIADIAYQRGDYDEALRIYREVQLPAFERLGDTREVGLAWVQDRRHRLSARRL